MCARWHIDTAYGSKWHIDTAYLVIDIRQALPDELPDFLKKSSLQQLSILLTKVANKSRDETMYLGTIEPFCHSANMSEYIRKLKTCKWTILQKMIAIGILRNGTEIRFNLITVSNHLRKAPFLIYNYQWK